MFFLNYVKDNVVKDNINAWHNEDGILIIGITEFLLNIYLIVKMILKIDTK